MLGEVMDNCLHLQECHEMDRDRDRVDLWYRNITQCIETTESEYLHIYLLYSLLLIHLITVVFNLRTIGLYWIVII